MASALAAPKRFQLSNVIGPATALAVAPGASAVIGSVKAPLEVDVYLIYYGISIGTAGNANFATFLIRVDGVVFRTDNTQFGALNTPTRLPVPQKLGQGCLVELVGVMGAGAVGNTDMAAVAGLMYVAPGQIPIPA